MVIRRSATRLLGHAIHPTTLSRWILAVAIIGGGLAYQTVALRVRGSAAPIEHIRSTPVVKVIVPARGAEDAHTALGPRSARPSSPTLSGAKSRFGFLEFEDDADAPAERFLALRRCAKIRQPMRGERIMATWTPDPSFYPSPRMAMKAAPEMLAYVASFDPERKSPDAIAVVDVDPISKSYATDHRHDGDAQYR